MELVIVILIVAAAAIYVGRIFYKSFKEKDGCACGCTCCSVSDSCSEPASVDTPKAASTQMDR